MTVSIDGRNPQVDPDLDQWLPRQPGRTIADTTLLAPAAALLEQTLRCVVTAPDRAGRLADRSLVHQLGWSPHLAVRFDVRGDVIHVSAAASGPTSITTQGHLRLPLAIRRRCRIDAGTRLLVAGRPGTCALTICTMATVDEMLLARLATADQPPGSQG